jgi:hypothetical protein
MLDMVKARSQRRDKKTKKEKWEENARLEHELVRGKGLMA